MLNRLRLRTYDKKSLIAKFLETCMSLHDVDLTVKIAEARMHQELIGNKATERYCAYDHLAEIE